MSFEKSKIQNQKSKIKNPLRVLIIEDSEDDTLLLLRELQRGGYDPIFERVETPEAMRDALEKKQWDIIISDYVMPRFSGLTALSILKESVIDLPFIIISGNIGEDIAVEAMKAGAHDYIIKGNLKRLIPTVERELREAKIRRENRRLESIAEAVNVMNNIGYVFSGIRHEIGNPINSVKMTLNVLKKNFDKYEKSDVMRYIDRAIDDTSRVEYLLKSLKNFNIYEKPELRVAEVDSFIYNFYALVFGDSTKRGITVIRTVEPEATFFYADPRALQQVLLNVFTNAMDACEEIENPQIEITVSKVSDMILIRIADNGKGMTQEQLGDLFKPFHTTKPHGTGLGLVICKKMLSAMGAIIEVQSQKEAGTTVDIFIPERKNDE